MFARMAVLLPVRDAERTLPACLESLRLQTFRNFRVIVVDDGSRDGTPEILAETARLWDTDRQDTFVRPGSTSPDSTAGPRLTVVRLDAGVGIARALAVAAEHTRDEPFLARQDADDQSLPERFARQMTYLEAHPQIGVLATDARTVREGAATEGWERYEAWLATCHTPREVALNLWVESPLPHPTVILRRDAYLHAGGYREVPWPEDYDLWLRMHRAGIAMAKLPEVLYLWGDTPGRASRTLAAYSPESFLACRAHHMARHLAGRPVILWGAGRDGRRAARALLREGVCVEAFLDIDPRKIGHRAYGRPILSAEGWLAGTEASRADTRPGGLRAIVLAAVGAAGARDLIRARLLQAGLEEGPDFLCIA